MAWWAPRRLLWWIGVLFAIGSTCFFVGPIPGFVELVGSAVDGAVFFVGSIFFTTAAALQCLHSYRNGRRPLDWSSSLVQFAGTILFNVDTFRALQTGFDDVSYDRLVWTPDALGSACFLVSGYLAYVDVSGRAVSWRPRDPDWRIAAVNLLGCIAFGISAVASYVVPSTGDVLNLARANAFTSFGGLCFLVGALLLVRRAAPRPSARARRGRAPAPSDRDAPARSTAPR
jgi:hypothetical protein